MVGKLKRITLTILLSVYFAGCATSSMEGSQEPDSEFSQLDGSAETTTDSGGSLDEELSQIEGDTQSQEEKLALNENNEPPKESNLEQEFQQSDQQAPPETQELVLEEEPPAPMLDQSPPPEAQELVLEEPEPVIDQAQQVPPPVVEPAVPVEPPPMPEELAQGNLVNIKGVQFKAFDGGGTVTVEADGPMKFSTRKNEKTKQFIVEIPNSKLSKRAARALNTRDFQGGIGSIDPYQNPGSDVSRVVVQLRDGVADPVVQTEGNVLMIISEPRVQQKVAQDVKDYELIEDSKISGLTEGQYLKDTSTVAASGVSENVSPSSILSTASLQEYIGGNQKFYGKKISIEANDAEVRDIIKFISEESGVNLVLSEDVKGKLTVKLKEIPWDQALVIVMKAKKLGYTRQGDVLRVAQLRELQEEELNYQKLVADKQGAMPLTVKMFPISYSKVEDLVIQIKPFLSERGKIVAEPRTSSVVISDTPEGLDRAKRLIQSLDIPPSQVLIEGKIVEARDTFQKDLGINWNLQPEQNIISTTNRTGQQVTSGMGLNFGAASRSYGNLSFSIQQLDFLGDFAATLSLGETEGKVKVLSSPRILTLHNEPAEINQNTQIPYLTYPTTSTGATASTPQVNFKDVKLKLSVTPLITNDASVIMSVNMIREFAGLSGDDGGARPINSREAKTKVIVKNGQTAVIGGIYQSDASDSTSGVPGLSKIPVLGWFFKYYKETLDKNELLIFLTPRIVGQADSGVSSPAPVNIPASSELKLENEKPEGGVLQ